MQIALEAEYEEEERMLIELVQSFVEKELMPLEKVVMQREAEGHKAVLTPEEEAPLLEKCKELGLFALDAPEEVGGVSGCERRHVDQCDVRWESKRFRRR